MAEHPTTSARLYQVEVRLAGVETEVECAVEPQLEEHGQQLAGLRQQVVAVVQEQRGMERRLTAVERRVELSGARDAAAAASPPAVPDAVAALRQRRQQVPAPLLRVPLAGRQAVTAAAQPAVVLHRGGRGPGLQIGGLSFRTQDDAWALINRLKHQLLDRPIGRDDAPAADGSFRFLEGLLARHPKGAAKVPHPSVCGFVSRRNVFGTGIEFHFVDACGTEHDFSALKCMEQRDAPGAAKLADAMHVAVRDQKRAFRDTQRQFCRLCGTGGRAQLAVDHDSPTMPQLRGAFLRVCCQPPPRVFDDEPGTNASMFRAQDWAFELQWRHFHQQHARLRLLCKRCLWLENERRGIRQCKGRLLMPDRR